LPNFAVKFSSNGEAIPRFLSLTANSSKSDRSIESSEEDNSEGWARNLSGDPMVLQMM